MQYQVLPFVYSHMVSMCCTAYLLSSSFVKGLYFSPDATLTFGLFLPLSAVCLSTVSVLGLIETGSAIANPFGSDPEDFTVSHFVHQAAISTK